MGTALFSPESFPVRIFADRSSIPESVYIGLVVAFFSVSVVGLAVLGAPGQAGEEVNATQPSFVEVSGDRASIPSRSLRTICLGSGCIPSLEDPSYVSAGQADGWLNPGDDVVAVSAGGESRAFPLKILQMHGVVNDEVGGTPVAVTYSPYSGVAAAFSREVGDNVLRLEHSGKLYRGNMVMRDGETGTLWSQLLGAGMKGELSGERLEKLNAYTSRWSIWRRNHPSGEVLSRETGIYPAEQYTDDPYFGYRRYTDVPFHDFESRIHPKEVVYGVSVEEGQKAYRQIHLNALDIVQERVDGEPVLLVQDEGRDRILGFSRTVDGGELDFQMSDGELVDAQTGSTWTLDGEATSGPLEGEELSEIDLTRSYWFAWKLFYPETEIYSVRG